MRTVARLRAGWVAAALCASLGCGEAPPDGDVAMEAAAATFGDAEAIAVLERSRTQLARTAAVLASTQSPKSTQADGTWTTVSSTDRVGWTQGFFPGAMWLLYEDGGDPAWRSRADRWTRALEGQKTNTETHDLGFKLLDSFGHAFRITGDAYYRDVLLTAAASLASRYAANPGIVSCCDWNGDWTLPLVVDTMMNLELLLWGAQNGGRAEWQAMAVSHALRTLGDAVRPDGSTYHYVDYDPATGEILSRGTFQGYGDETTWARGQAWTIYGFTMVYRYTRDARMLAAAQRTADYYLARVGADMVPNWDLDAPQQQKDSSAAAIVASALLELAGFAAEAADQARYRDAALRTLATLSSAAYLSSGTSTYGVLLHGVGHYPAGREIDVSLIYGDYYLLEAVLRFLGPRTTRVAIPFGSTWRYYDGVADPGAQWIAPTYVDDAWRSGPAQLGYGDGDEATRLARATTSQPSVLFRRHVTLGAPPTQASLRVVHDDGVAVWVNGVLVFSRHVGSLAFSAYATGTSADNELSGASISLASNPFRAGDNVVAVMVKQAGPSSSDTSFDLELTVTDGGGEPPPPPPATVTVLSPNGGETLAAGATHAVRWSTTGTVAGVRIDLSTDGGASWQAVAASTPNDGTHDWTVPAVSTTTALVRVSEAANAAVADASDAHFTISTGTGGTPYAAIARRSAWRYDDAGVDRGTAWLGTAYDDSAWRTGAAQLGYGDGDEATLLRKTSPSLPTFYFRRRITVDAPVTAARLEVLFDDAIAVWVNGQLVLSRNMGNGTSYGVYASGSSGDNAVVAVDLATQPFVVGENVVAAMVKQASGSSSDVSFDLGLSLTTSGGGTPPPPPPAAAVTVLSPNGGETLAAGATHAVRWSTTGTVTGVRIDLSTDGGASWQPIAASTPNDGTHDWTVPAVSTATALVRVSDAADAGVADASDAAFSISPGTGSTTYVAIARGALWRYDDAGIDRGTVWLAAGYDDSAWRSGRAQLGYGEGDEATVLRRASPAAPSYYFRAKVQVSAAVERARLTAVFDDAVAVWVNGQLVFARNMGNGTSYAVYASGSSGDNAVASVDLATLPFVVGENVVAVMVKQASGSSSDVSFDLELSLTTSGGGGGGTAVTYAAIARRSTWRYDDSGVDRGAAWLAIAYDDAAWRSGAAQLGYGDGDEATLLRKTSPVLPSYYFRRRITVDGTATAARLEVLFDDAVAVWVNGQQLFSRNVGNGTSYAVYASGSSGDNAVVAADVPVTAFVPGENVVAVMVKQASGSSSDLSFDLGLTLTVQR